MEKNGQPIGNQPQADAAAAELGRLVLEPPGFVKYVPAIIVTGIPSRKPV